jgi:hypothetical protein
MTDHDRAAHHATEAERLLVEAEGRKMNKELGNIATRKANVHATLAVYYATVARA